MENNIIVVKQLPVIEERLQQVKTSIDSRIAEVLSLHCTEETRQDVKKMRTELRKEFDELENVRKNVKSAILAPYSQFEALYKECAADPYKRADETLKTRIDAVETELKETKAAEIEFYFDEVRESLGIPENLVSLERSGIKVTLSASVPSLKRQAVAFLERVSGDLEYIQSLENSAEVMVEYRKTLNAIQSVGAVSERHKAMEAERARLQAQQEAAAVQMAAQENVQTIIQEEAALQPPTAEPIAEQTTPEQAQAPKRMCAVTFRVTASLEQLKALKKFLTEGGYQYESV